MQATATNDSRNQGLRLLKWIVCITFFIHLMALVSKVSTTSDFILSKPEEEVIRITFMPKPKKTKQIVESEKSRSKQKPQSEAFLGKEDNNVNRQTVAKKIDRYKTAGIGVRNGAKAGSAQTKSKHQKKQKKISLSDLQVKKKSEMMKEYTPAGGSAPLGLKTGDKQSKGLAASNDFVEEIPLGDFTQLNTTEYKFYGFYHRIKLKLEQFWGATIQEKVSKLYKSGRNLASGENHMTSLIIHLDKMGKIIGVNVKGTSGYKELDEAAVESFNRAGPFPNPPKGMIKNGKATIEWGFVVKS